MKELLVKFKAGFITLIVITIILMAITAFRYVKATGSAEKAAKEKLASIPEEELHNASWCIPEIQEKMKDIHWMERTLTLAKSDSLNLGINLADSIVQVQLKGTVLLQAKIKKQMPSPFFEKLNYGTYLDFTKIATITEEAANLPKRPIIKVQAPKNENEVKEVKKDTIPDPVLVWQFALDNKIDVIITGIGLGKDSLPETNFNKDLLKYNVGKIKKHWLPENYQPTLYLWLDDNDAKAIFRAIPEKGKVAFKN